MATTDTNSKSGLTAQEQAVSDALIAAWNAFLLLPDVDPDDLADFRRSIHEGQRILAARVAAHDYPEHWKL